MSWFNHPHVIPNIKYLFIFFEKKILKKPRQLKRLKHHKGAKESAMKTNKSNAFIKILWTDMIASYDEQI